MKLTIPEMWAVLRNDGREAKELAVHFYDSLVNREVEVSSTVKITIERYREELKDSDS